MDRNSVIGLSLIGLIIIAYTIFTQPGAEELQEMRRKQDSTAAAQAALKTTPENGTVPLGEVQNAIVDSTKSVDSDSLKNLEINSRFGTFASSAQGEEKIFNLENDKFRVEISNKGGKIKAIELKDYKTYDGQPVRLMSSDSMHFGLTLPAQNRIISIEELYFSQALPAANSNSLNLRISAGEGKYIEYVYSIEADSYLLNFRINMNGMQDVIGANNSFINLDWNDYLQAKEQSLENERHAATIYYRFSDEDVDHLSPTSDKKESLKTKVKWIAFKQQFFTVALISENSFESPVVETKSEEGSSYVKYMSASFSLPFEHKDEQSYGMQFYAGPNHYQTLKKIGDYNLEKLIPLGWGIFGWVNRFLVIPTFNFLNSFNLNYGIIILLLTILVRIILLPLTYGSFKSQAKMKVLQPEMMEINEKFKEDPMKKQQEVMSLYRKAGVNPLGGCIPGLLQLPILIAMFNFFPSSIELRQESFLWAKDLSTYDSILDLPFKIPFYGAHVSLFTLLMTVSTIIYTRVNMQMTTATNPQMKWMMYLMPILFLGFFNNYSAGLSYYYFLSNLFGFGQQYLFKAFIDQDAIHRQIQENKKKPVKKSAFQQRLETMAKERGMQSPKKR